MKSMLQKSFQFGRVNHWQVVISLLTALVFIISCPAFAASPRSLESAIAVLENEAKKASTIKQLKIGYIKATFSGVHVTYEANFYSDENFIHAQIDHNGKVSLTQKAISSESMKAKWRSVSTEQTIPDLDSLLVEAESIIRGDGFIPTGLAMMKFNYYPATPPHKKEWSKTTLFFQVESSDKARVVQFENADFLSHGQGTLLQIPVVRIPELSTPKLKPVKINLPQKIQQSVQSFTTDEDETLLRIEGDFLFDFDSYDPRPEANELIQSLTPIILEKKPTQLFVEGHTDSWGTPQYNDNLSTQRAKAIADLLIANGVARSIIVIKGYGETRPVAVEMTQDGKDNPSARQENRRVELRFR